jgi:queuine tRNA-ribosyltransferase
MSPLSDLSLAHGTLRFPVYLPDATYGIVRAADAADLEACGVQGIVMNTFHLMQRPGSSTIQSLGGLHKMSGWQRPIITDSGGFQAYSLIRQNPKFGSLGERGISFQPENGTRKFLLTPEKTIQLQYAYGADVIISLDDCTHVDASYEQQQQSVERTIAWAKRGKKEFDRLNQQKRLPPGQTPLIFGVIQGGGYLDLRQRCADALLEIGFDGFGFGGWPLDNQGHLLTDMIAATRAMVPAQLPMHALGVGHPANVLACWQVGYEIFDSAMPTRDARHGRLYRFTEQAGLTGEWWEYLYITDERHIKADRPISEWCPCPVCQRYSLGYLHHLYKLGEVSYQRLATMHNLAFMAQLTDRIRENTL